MYYGSSVWNDFRSPFQACSSINGCDNLDKGLYSAAFLRSQALDDPGDLSDDMKILFDQLQLKERTQKASGSLPELGQTIRQLKKTAPGEVRETSAKGHF